MNWGRKEEKNGKETKKNSGECNNCNNLFPAGEDRNEVEEDCHKWCNGE